MIKLITSISISFYLLGALNAYAENVAPKLSGTEIMQNVDQREEGEQVTRRSHIELKNRRNTVRSQKTIAYKKHFGDEKRTIIFYTEPTNVRGTGFLTFDYKSPDKDDHLWLYLPALRKVRRISSSDRGEYFLGTDFTYEEIKKEQKVELQDYTFERKGTDSVNDVETLVVEGTPVNSDIAEELGYSRVVWRIDPAIWMSLQSDYYDLGGNHFKTTIVEKVEKIGGIDTATKIFSKNHITEHSTRITFSDVDYTTDIKDNLFSQARLRRGF